jgi:hypothetical protein
MASVKQDDSSLASEIDVILQRHLGKRSRRIEVIADMNFDGESVTRIEVDLDAEETHDVSRLNRMRQDVAQLFLDRPDIIAPQLIFRAHMRAKASLSGKGYLSDPDVSDIIKMIEKLPA